jgi:phospholipase C
MNWVTPIGQASDHPGNTKGGEGPSWVSAVVNAIGNNTACDGAGYWSDTVMLILWDDWGGWYDHEAPTIAPGVWGDYEDGFRVPLVVVSAYTPQAYVSNERHDFGSVVRFVEGILGLGEGALGFADARSHTDLNEFFNFKMQPRPFQAINATLNAEYFLNDKRKPDPPDDY